MPRSVLTISFLLTLILGSIPLLGLGQYVLEVQNYQGIPYISGGVGLEEREALKRMEMDFNLKVTLAVREGNYLGEVRIRIEDSQGNTLLEATSDGPWFYAELAPGAYTVQASAFGREQNKTVQVPEHGQREVHFYWEE